MVKITVEQSHQLMAALATHTDWDKLDFDAAQIQDRFLKNPEEGSRSFLNFLRGAMLNIFCLPIRRGESLEKMIDAGHYDWTHENITKELFRIDSEGDTEYEGRFLPLCIDDMSVDVVRAIKMIDRIHPWMPAKTEHILSLGEHFPEVQWKHQIIAFGAEAYVFGDLNVLCLEACGGERRLDLRSWTEEWDHHCLALAVREVSTA